MDLNYDKGVVTLYGKNLKLDTLLKKFAQLNGEQVYHFLINRGIQLPRRLNCLALVSVLNRKIKFLHSNSLSKDYFTRLQYYKYFTEQQLFNLFLKICNDENSFYAYRYNLFKLIVLNFVGLNLNDGELTYLKNVKKSQMESFEQYFNYVSGSALEQEDTFDGQSIDVLKEKLVVSASNQEVFDLAGKYGIELPARLKKDDFLAFILYHMQKNNTYNDEIAEELQVMTISQLTTYARRTGVPMQPAMSKQDLITYLFYYLEQCSIEQTSVRRLEIPDEFQPLEFTVDLNAISIFGSDELKKVIHYANEEDDKEELDSIINVNDDEDEEYVEEEVPAEEPNTEAVVEEPQIEANEVTEEVIEEQPQEEVVEEVIEEQPQEEVSKETEEVEYVEETEETEEVEYVEETEEAEEVEYVEETEETEEVEYVEETEETEEVEYVEETEKTEETAVDSDDDIDDETIQAMLAASQEPKEDEHATIVNKFDNVKKNEYFGDEKIEKLAEGPGKLIATLICAGIAVCVLVFCVWALFR